MPLMLTYEQVVAAQQAQQQRELERQRTRTIPFALEAVDGDGFARVSWYTCDTLRRIGLIEPVPGDNLGRDRLTPEGRIMLHANPPGASPSDELTLFGEPS